MLWEITKQRKVTLQRREFGEKALLDNNSFVELEWQEFCAKYETNRPFHFYYTLQCNSFTSTVTYMMFDHLKPQQISKYIYIHTLTHSEKHPLQN